MNSIATGLIDALALILTLDSDLVEIISLSLTVTFSALAGAILIGVPLGAIVGITRFPGRMAIILSANTLMGLPPVVVGLVVYMLLSRTGPLGTLGLLYTQKAMVIAQTLLITPIIIALTRQIIESLNDEYEDLLSSMGLRGWERAATLLWDGRFALITVAMAGLGRAMAEVGAVMIVGGNIDHATRTMTTAIALETSRGNLRLALALGLVLILIALVLNGGLMMLRLSARRMAYV